MPTRGPLWRFASVKPEEGRVLALAVSYGFFLFASYYVLRPLRDALALVGNIRTLPWLFLLTLAVTLAVNPLFSALVSRVPRRRFIPLTYHLLALNLLLFWAVLHWLPHSVLWARVFFVWASVFNLFAVSVFWAFMADVFTAEQGTRLFGLIGVGNTLGAMLGAGLTTALARAVGSVQLLFVSAALLELAVLCVVRLGRRFGAAGELAPGEGVAEPELVEGSMLAGLRAIATSRYLLGICAYLLLYTFTGTLVYFEQAHIVEGALPSANERVALFAKLDLGVNLLALVTQLFLSGQVLRRLGVGATLMVLPLVTLGGLLTLGVFPTLAVLVVFQVVRRAVDYALIRPAREVLFTVVPREEKYKAKSFIDTFVYRLGDASGAWASGVVGAGVTFFVVTCLAAPLCLLWVLNGFFLGRGEKARE